MGKTIHSAEHRVLIGLLREARQRAGLTQLELATALNRPQSFVSKYEAGERRLDLVELGEIVDQLGVKLVTLVKKYETARLSK